VGANDLYDAILQLGLDVETIVGVHGDGTATLEHLKAAAGR
jgi:hypothetical protein